MGLYVLLVQGLHLLCKQAVSLSFSCAMRLWARELIGKDFSQFFVAVALVRGIFHEFLDVVV